MNRFFRICCVCLLLLLYIDISAQSNPLPRHLTNEELEILGQGKYFPPILNHSTNLRSGLNYRAIAEWEEMQAVAITWRSYRSILAEIVRHAVNEVKVLIFYQPNITSLGSLKSYLLDRDIDPEFNIEYVEANTNSIWIRDYGANPVYMNDVDTLAFVDWIYNRPRFNDDLIPIHTATHFEAPLLSTTVAPYDLVHTGGNFMSDGLGNGFSSMLVLDENGPMNTFGTSNHSESEVDLIMESFMGIQSYPKMENLPFDLIHHIDMHMKLLDEETLLVGKYPDGIADGPQIEANLQYLIEQFTTAYGRSIKVKRILMPPDQFGRYPHEGGFYRTYTNALFLNGTILVPTYELKYDTTALSVWSELMPGYQIRGINCNDIIPASGALHCITKEVGVEEPLWITHMQPVEAELWEPLMMTVQAKHVSGIESVFLHLQSENEDSFKEEEMIRNPEDQWIAYLSFDTPGKYRYFFRAKSNSGKEINRPIVAPDGYFFLDINETTTSKSKYFIPEKKVRVYPNPANQLTCIEIHSNEVVKLASIDLLALNGTVIDRVYHGPMNKEVNNVFFQAQNYHAGVYYIRLASVKHLSYHKVIIH